MSPLNIDQVESAAAAMRQAAVNRVQSQIPQLTSAKQVVSADSQAAIDHYTKVLNTSFQVPTPEVVPQGDVGQGFRLAGQVTLASDGNGIPGMRLRLIDASGAVQMEDPTWMTGPDGRYTMSLSPADAKARASQSVELADAEGNALMRLDRSVAPGEAITANVALPAQPAGSALANQISMARAQVDALNRAKAQLQAHIDALKARQVMDQQSIDAQIANLQAAAGPRGA